MRLSGSRGEERRTSPPPERKVYRWLGYGTTKQERRSVEEPVGVEGHVLLRVRAAFVHFIYGRMAADGDRVVTK